MLDESFSGNNCGVAGHGDDCLCDVVIKERTPINIRCAVRDYRFGPAIVNVRGYQLPWTDSEIVNYLESLVKAHDEIHGWGHVIVDMNHAGADEAELPVARWARIRNTVKQALAGTPKPPVLRVLEAMGISAEEFISAATTGKCVMSATVLAEFERVLIDEQPSNPALARQFHLSADTVEGLRKYWNLGPTKASLNRQANAPQVLRMKELIRDGYDNMAIINTLREELGVTLTSSSVSKCRKRMEQ